MSGQWQGSNRRNELPTNWPQIRQAVLARDGYQCTWLGLDSARCIERATDVDHIVNGGSHDFSNLRSLCAYHHKQKSSAEGNAARKRYTMRRPAQKHPGLL